MARLVLLMCWPPAPEERKVSIFRSAGSSSTLHLLRLGHHRHRDGGGVDAALGLGLGHPLHPVDAALELEAAVGSLALAPKS